MKFKLLFITLLISAFSFGQTTLAAWTFPTVSGSAPNNLVAECGVFSTSSNFYADGTNGSSAWTGTSYFTGTAPTSALCGVTAATGAYSLVAPASPFNNNFSVVYKLPTTGYQDLILTYSTRGTATGYTTHDWSYSTDGITFTPHATITGRNATAFSTQTVDFSAISSLDNLANVYIKLTVSGATALSGNNRFDNINFTGVSLTSSPTIYVSSVSLSGFTYVVGSGPSAQQSFNVSGTNLTANVVLTAPANYLISTTSGSGFTNSITLPFGTGTLASTPIYVILNSGLSVNTYTGNITTSSTGVATPPTVALTGNVTSSQLSDLVAVAGSSPINISSTINNPPTLTAATGIQVWQFKVRDGGASLNDADTLPTILNAFTIAQVANSVTIWTDAINTIALFDGGTWLANGTVTATNITFSGLNVSVADNTEKTLSLRLSLKCPLGPGALDNDHFGFSISWGNTTFSAAGSGRTTFTAIVNTAGTNNIDVTATRLLFNTQPSETGVNGTMTPAVTVRAVDACGNLDTSFTGSVSLTSSGTMTGSPLFATAVAGVATFSSIIHTLVASGLTLNATATGLTGVTSNPFNIVNVTVLLPGDIAILAFNTNIDGTGTDEVSFVNFVDILPSSTIDMTDNAYQKCGTPNGWGISEGWIRLVRKNSILLKGTIITVRINNGNPSIFSPDPGNWTCSKPQPASQGTFDLNNGGEQIFFMTGGNVGGPNTNTPTSDAGTYSGYFLYGFNTKGNIWTPICANSGGGGTQNSDKPINFDCFLVWPTAQADLNKYSGPLSPATQRDWIGRITDPNNWTGYIDNTAYATGYDFYGSSISILSGGYSSGIWIGNKSSNWFDCGNWQSLKVPDQTVNVVVGTNSTQAAVIDYTAPFSDNYLDIAKCNNLTISNFKVQAEASANNILEVNGNLTINTGGSLDLDDGNTATADGVIKLFGNWTNNVGNSAFQEGNSTVQFLGVAPQIINNVTPEGTETFYDVVLGNNFDTSVSNNLIASGNLTINATKTLTIAPTGYVRVNKALNLNGNLTIENNGQLIQVDEPDANIGTYSGTSFQVKRTAMVRNVDFVYWSSPVKNFPVASLPNGSRYEWYPLNLNTNGTQGNWVSPTTTNMTDGKGYIARAFNGSNSAIAMNFTFNNGKPNNGIITVPISRGNYYGDGIVTGLPYDAEPTNPNNVDTTRWDDNWNLVGNPYPSAINAKKFLQANTNIEGFVNIWTHNSLPTSIIDPFYQNFTYNYSSDDYITHNGTGIVSGPTGLPFDGDIASGQGFFILMNDGVAAIQTTESVTFNNAMRRDTTSQLPYNNTQFYRNSSIINSNEIEEKNRIWLDIVSPQGNSNRTLVGYVTDATNQKDRLYDAVTKIGNSMKIVSYIDESNPQEFCIQGRALPFNENDSVRLGVVTPSIGIYSIAIASTDGLFQGNQNIYLEDKFLNIIHDLKQSPYSFNSTIGVVTNRFVLRYTNGTLSNEDFNEVNNSITVVKNQNQLSIQSTNKNIQSVFVYDVLGREIIKKNNIANTEITFDTILISNQALIVKVVLENGQIITRKIVF